MAHLIPSDITRLALAGAHEPELRTLALLKDALPDDYTVFHGVHWSRQYKGVIVSGETNSLSRRLRELESPHPCCRRPLS